MHEVKIPLWFYLPAGVFLGCCLARFLAYLFVTDGAASARTVQDLTDVLEQYQRFDVVMILLSGSAMVVMLTALLMIEPSPPTQRWLSLRRWWLLAGTAAAVYTGWRMSEVRGALAGDGQQVLVSGLADPSASEVAASLRWAADHVIPHTGVTGLSVACMLCIGYVAVVWQAQEMPPLNTW